MISSNKINTSTIYYQYGKTSNLILLILGIFIILTLILIIKGQQQQKIKQTKYQPITPYAGQKLPDNFK